MLSWIVPLLVGSAIAAVIGLRDLRGVPALEPGPGAAPGVDHAGDLGDPRRPDARPRRRPRRSRWRGPRRSPTSSRSSASATPPAGCSSSASPSSSAPLLWLWLNRTRMGIVIRAGVADQAMVRALGINIGIVFAITFFVGSFLAGMGGVMVASFAGVATGADGQWLLHSLVVVIIGGLGSIKGAVAGSLLYGMVSAFAPVYLPSDYTYYSIIFTFALLAIVLAVRPYGLFGRPGRVSERSERSRPAGDRQVAGRRRGSGAQPGDPVHVRRRCARSSSRSRRPAAAAAGRHRLLRQLRAHPHADPRAGGVVDRVPVELRRHGVARPVPAASASPGSRSATAWPSRARASSSASTRGWPS